MYKQLSKSLIFLFLALLVSLCFGSFVYAVDGVIEINQPRALAGGVTPGDDPGFPVIISESGSYRLTGNLTVENGNAIEIDANNVTLDLNGFSIIGGSGSCIGVLGNHYNENITVVNGSVCSMGSNGILLAGTLGRVEKVHAVHNSCGISVYAGIVSSCIAYGNTGFGLMLGTATGYANNVLTNNNVGNANGQVSGGIEIGTNLCGNDTTCP